VGTAPAPPGENSCALAETITISDAEARQRAGCSATCQPVMPGMDTSIMARSGLVRRREPFAVGAA
jgi:hypothetical protein